MTRGSVRALILLSFALGVALYTGGRVFWLFAIALVLLLAFSLVSCVSGSLGLRLTHSMRAHTYPKGAQAELVLEAQNRSILPIAQVSMTYRLPDFGRPAVWTRDFMMPARGSARFVETIACQYRGAYTVGIESVAVQDLFGLFCMRRRIGEALPLMIVPRVLPTGVGIERPGMGDQSHAMGAEEVTVPADVRTYREGDAMKRIHWKLSARLRELMVRTFEIPNAPMLTLYLDLSPLDADRAVSIEREDQLIEAVVALTNAFLLDDQPVRLVALGAHRVVAEAESMSGFPVLFELFSSLPFDAKRPIEEMLAAESFEGCDGGVCVATAKHSEALVNTLKTAQVGQAPIWLLLSEPPEDDTRPMLERMGIDLLLAREVIGP